MWDEEQNNTINYLKRKLQQLNCNREETKAIIRNKEDELVFDKRRLDKIEGQISSISHILKLIEGGEI